MAERIPPFSPQHHLEAACRGSGRYRDRGLTGSEIGYLLKDVKVADVAPDFTKWKRLFNALAEKPRIGIRSGNHLIMFINRAMNPVNYARKRDF